MSLDSAMSCEKLGETKTYQIMKYGLASWPKGFDNHGLNSIFQGVMWFV